MRTNILIALLLALLVAGCARRGVVVDKRLKPSPFAYSAGIDGVYSFLLRDEQGRVHSQMVSPEVFSRFEVGDYFDDQRGGPVRHEQTFNNDVSDAKAMQPVSSVPRRNTNFLAEHRKSAVKKHMAGKHKTHKTLRAVAKPREEDLAPVVNAPKVQPAPEPQGLDVHP